MRDYELVYILNPDLAEDSVNDLMNRFQGIAQGQGAEILSQERWEKRRLAYEIKDKREGTYVVMEFHSNPNAVQELDRLLKITDGVLRHIIVRAEDVKSAADRTRESANGGEVTPGQTAPTGETVPALDTEAAATAAEETAPQEETAEAEDTAAAEDTAPQGEDDSDSDEESTNGEESA